MENFQTGLTQALGCERTADAIRVMHLNGRLKEYLPDVDRLFDVPERADFHPEGNSGAHTLLTIKEIEKESPRLKYAMLLHDLGKIVTFDEQLQKAEESGEPYDKKDLTKHFGHAEKGLQKVEEISDLLGVPADWKEFAALVCKQHMKAHDLDKMKDAKLFEFNKEVPDQYFDDFMKCCLADALGRDVSEAEKKQIREDFATKSAKLLEVRDYMHTHPSEDKSAFANNFARYKKQISNG